MNIESRSDYEEVPKVMQYRVLVANIGEVWSGTDKTCALQEYKEYSEWKYTESVCLFEG